MVNFLAIPQHSIPRSQDFRQQNQSYWSYCICELVQKDGVLSLECDAGFWFVLSRQSNELPIDSNNLSLHL